VNCCSQRHYQRGQQIFSCLIRNQQHEGSMYCICNFEYSFGRTIHLVWRLKFENWKKLIFYHYFLSFLIIATPYILCAKVIASWHRRFWCLVLLYWSKSFISQSWPGPGTLGWKATYLKVDWTLAWTVLA
jgi:hypothetical protein